MNILIFILIGLSFGIFALNVYNENLYFIIELFLFLILIIMTLPKFQNNTWNEKTDNWTVCLQDHSKLSYRDTIYRKCQPDIKIYTCEEGHLIFKGKYSFDDWQREIKLVN